MDIPFRDKAMERKIALTAMWCVAVSACTPLGAWVYDDPGFEVQRVRLRPGQVTDSSLVVALLLWNPNDYALATVRFDLKLRLDEATVGQFTRDSIVPMDKVETTELALPFTPTSSAAGKLDQFIGGKHTFLVEGRATFDTPFGERTLRVAHSGEMAFGGDEQAAGNAGGVERRSGPPLQDWSSTVWPRLEPKPNFSGSAP
jgi:hypothetical protein